MNEDNRKKHQKDMIIVIGGLVIVLFCLIVVGVLLYQSLGHNQQVPEYALAFFSSIATLIIGYIFGNNK